MIMNAPHVAGAATKNPFRRLSIEDGNCHVVGGLLKPLAGAAAGGSGILARLRGGRDVHPFKKENAHAFDQ